MNSAWFRSTFFRLLKFLEIKEGGRNFLGESILQKSWIIWSLLLCFNFKSFIDPDSSSLIRFQFILLDSEVPLSDFSNIYKLEGRPNFWGEPILQKVWIISSHHLYFNLKGFMDVNSSWFVWFQCILHGSGVIFSESWNFYKLKMGDLFSGGNQFCKKSKLFAPSFCIWTLKLSSTKILRHWLDFNEFCLNQKTFCQTFEISTN